MSDDKTPDEAKTSAPKISVSPANEEPKQTNAKSVGAKPAARKIAHDAVVGTGDTDTIKYSSAKASNQKKVLTVLHIQRALMDRGYAEAASAPGGWYEILTSRAVQAYQRDRNDEATGVLTRDQFEDLFVGDPNVTLHLDTHADHV